MTLSRLNDSFALRLAFAAMLLPAFVVSQVDLLRQLGATSCPEIAEASPSDCGGCCDSGEAAKAEAAGTPDEREECGLGCETCPCCPSVATGLVPGPTFLTGHLPLRAVDRLAPREPEDGDPDRLFRPPRAC